MRTGIALGSNVGDRLEALVQGRTAVLSLDGVSGPVLCSSLYETEPVDTPEGSGRFLNAVMEVEYEGDPAALLSCLQQIEARLGRPAVRALNAPRVIDLDILYTGSQRIFSPELTLPHPRLHLRRFVLAPLAEIRPSLCLPGFAVSVEQLLRELSDPAQAALASTQWDLR